jgi:hypothetical protein
VSSANVQPRTLSGQQHLHTAVGYLNLAYAYNYEGQLSSVTYPTDAYGTPSHSTYLFDPMMRPSCMTDQTNNQVVNSVTYGPANELKHISDIPGCGFVSRYGGNP